MSACVFLPQQASAQAPQKMSYQAVIRDNSNALVTNQVVGMQISILQGSANGTAVYAETQAPTTNANGLASIEIGGGTLVSGNFATINWANGPYFIKTETDPTGGTNYTITGTSQLLSVPYAQYAEKSGNPILQAGSGITIQNDSIINTAPNQQVNLSGTGQTNITGTYPNFSVNTPPYIAGTGINISGSSISAQNTNAIWNANKLQGKNIDTLSPALGNVLQYDGSKWKPYEKLPQMTTAQREALTNVYTGMTILNTNTDCIEYYNGTKWLATCGTEGEVGSSETGGLQQGGQLILDSYFPYPDTSFVFGSFAIGNNLYLILQGTTSVYSLIEYNTITKTYTQKANCPFTSSDLGIGTVTTADSTFGYFFNFKANGSNTNVVSYKYNPTGNFWVTSPVNIIYDQFAFTKLNFIGIRNSKACFIILANTSNHFIKYELSNNTMTDILNAESINNNTFITVGFMGYWKDFNNIFFSDCGTGIIQYSFQSDEFNNVNPSSVFWGCYLNGSLSNFNNSILFNAGSKHYFLKNPGNGSTNYFELYEVNLIGHSIRNLNVQLEQQLISIPTQIHYINGKIYSTTQFGIYKLIL